LALGDFFSVLVMAQVRAKSVESSWKTSENEAFLNQNGAFLG
jgi:hypothetical protein